MGDNAGQAPPGWYPDPSGAPRQRYFDGEIWTDHYHEDAAPVGGDPAAATFGGYAEQTYPVGLSDPGALLSDAWATVKAKFGLLLGVTIGFGVAVGVVYALFIAWLFSRLDNVNSFDDFGDTFAEFIIAYIAFVLIAGLVYSVYVLIVTRVLHLQHRGRPASLDAAWTKAKQRVWPFYGTAIALYIGFYIGIFILALVLTAIAPALVFLIIVPTIYAWVKWGFLPIAAVATGRGDSMVSASMAVSDGRFWPVLGRMLMVSLPLIGSYVLSFVVLAATVDSTSNGPAVIFFLVMLVGGVVGGLIMASGLTKLYLDSGAPSDL